MKIWLIPAIITGFLMFLTAFAGNPKVSGHKVQIAVCQIFCLDGDRAGNFARIEHALQKAKKMGAEIACFPETAIYGWVNPEAHDRAHPIPGKDSDRLCDLARQYGMYIAVGLAEKDGESLYDTAILIDDRGDILLKHRKFNILSELMNPPYRPGTGDISIAETCFGKIGMMICADSFVKDHVSKLAQEQPDLVVIPYGWAEKESAWPEHGLELEKVVAGVARTTRAPVVGTDLVGQISHGPWRGRVYGGQSVVVDAEGKVLARGKDRDRNIVTLTISMRAVNKDLKNQLIK